MRTYVLRRLLQTIPLLLGISLITFLLLQLAPGDFLNQMAENPGISAETIEAMRVRFGLDKPWYIQYAIYLRNVILHFDFGQSFARHQPVFDVISEGFTNTLILAGAAAFITWVACDSARRARRGETALVGRPRALVYRLHLVVGA